MKINVTLLMRIHECISREATGCPDYMAQNFGISKRFLHNLLEYMKKEFEAPIAYSRVRETYYYTQEWDLYIGDLRRIRAELIKEVMEAIHNTVRILLLVGFFIF